MKDTRIGTSGCRTKLIPCVATQAKRIVQAVRNRRAAGESTITISDYNPSDAILAAFSEAELAELDN